MMPAGYGVVLILWYAYYGVLFSFSLGLVFLALLPLTFLLGRSAQFVKELTPFIVLLMSYEALQGVAGSLTLAPVIHHAGSRTSYGIIEAVQSAFLSPDLTDVMSLFYGLHFPLVIGSAILLWYSNRVLYKRYLYSLVACSYVSLVFDTSSLSTAMVQRCRLQPTCNYECSDRLVQPLLRTSEDCKPDRIRQACRFPEPSRCLCRTLQLLHDQIEESICPCQRSDSR